VSRADARSGVVGPVIVPFTIAAQTDAVATGWIDLFPAASAVLGRPKSTNAGPVTSSIKGWSSQGGTRDVRT